MLEFGRVHADNQRRVVLERGLNFKQETAKGKTTTRHKAKPVSRQMEGVPFDVNPSKINRKLFGTKMPVKHYEEIRHLILKAFAEEIFKLQNPNEMHKQGRYFGIMMKLDNRLGVLANVSYNKTDKIKYRLEGTLDDVRLVDDNGNFICNVSYIHAPAWYSEKTRSNKPTSEVFIDEGETFLHMTYSGCDYGRYGIGCKFCGCTEEINNPTADEIAETVDFAKEEPQYQVCLGGGTTLPLSKSTEKFKEMISKIREKTKSIPIWVEMVPPTEEEIKELIDSGATSFGFNIEVFDEKLRKEICPGKSAISIDRYIERGKYANELLGGNKVGSTLICGIAPIETIKRGVDELTKNGIHPCILAFRPSENSEFEKLEECDDKVFLECSIYATKKC